MNRRSFVVGAASLSTVATFDSARSVEEAQDVPIAVLGESACVGVQCFDSDYARLGYDAYLQGFFVSARAGRFRLSATGTSIRAAARVLFESDRLHAVAPSTLTFDELPYQGTQATLYRVRFRLDCGIPIRGVLGRPSRRPRALICLAHGTASTPERCFDASSADYMGGVAAKLLDAGFLVWCPFQLQSGNAPSILNLVALMASYGISYTTVTVSAMRAGTFLSRLLYPSLRIPISYFGCSFGVYAAMYSNVAAHSVAPIVISGYFADDANVSVSEPIQRSFGSSIPYFMNLRASLRSFFFPGILHYIRPSPLYIQFVGPQPEFDESARHVLQDVRQIYGLSPTSDQVSIELTSGAHVVHPSGPLNWLSARFVAS